MRQITLKTFEGTRLTLGVVAAWKMQNLYIGFSTTGGIRYTTDIFHVVEQNGLTRTFPVNDLNKKALNLIFNPPAPTGSASNKSS